MGMVAVDSPLGTTSVGHKYKVIFCEVNRRLLAVHLAFNCPRNFFAVVCLFKDDICDLCVVLK